MSKLKRKTTTNHGCYRIVWDRIKYFLGLVLLILEILKRVKDFLG